MFSLCSIFWRGLQQEEEERRDWPWWEWVSLSLNLCIDNEDEDDVKDGHNDDEEESIVNYQTRLYYCKYK